MYEHVSDGDEETDTNRVNNVLPLNVMALVHVI